MTARHYKVPHQEHVYLTFIVESYEGLATVSTVDIPAGIVRITPAAGRDQEWEGLLEALRGEIGMEELAYETRSSGAPENCTTLQPGAREK